MVPWAVAGLQVEGSIAKYWCTEAGNRAADAALGALFLSGAYLALEPDGPIATFGSSEVSQPLPNLLLQKALLAQVANGGNAGRLAAVGMLIISFEQAQVALLPAG